MIEVEEIFEAATLYREWGVRFNLTDKLNQAIKYFRKAMEEGKEQDLRVLLPLCEALRNFTRFQEAAKFAEQCMEIDPNYYKVLYNSVESLFKIGEFGYSLIRSHQGFKKRRVPFEWCVFQAEETINDVIGENTSPTLMRDLYPKMLNVERYRENLIELLKQDEDEFKDIGTEVMRFTINDPEIKLKKHFEALHRHMAQSYLGLLAQDKHFIADLMNHPDLMSANKAGSEKICEMLAKIQERSTYRQDTLRTRKPLYVAHCIKKARPIGHKMMLEKDRKIRKCLTIQQANLILQKLHYARINRDFHGFFQYAERAKVKFDLFNQLVFPRKSEYLGYLYKMIGRAYLDARDLSFYPDEDVKLLYLQRHLGIRISKIPQDVDIGWMPILDNKKALNAFRERIALANEPLELAWLFHELSKFFTEIHRYDLGRYYLKKASHYSQQASSAQWALNSIHLNLRIEVAQHNRNEAKEAALSALAAAKAIGFSFLIDFYTRALDFINHMEIEKFSLIDNIKKREELIMSVMTEDIRSKYGILLQKMNVVPARRRLSVMPGCKPVDRQYKFQSTTQSILPGPPRNPEIEHYKAMLKRIAPSNKIPGWIDFEDYE